MKRFDDLSVLLLLGLSLLSCTDQTDRIRIAVPDDLGGIPGYYAIRDQKLSGTALTEELFPLTDCCNTTTEWALSADRVDMAWLCPDAARMLVGKDGRFEIIGPAVVNSQILVIGKGGAPTRIAYSHKRNYQKALIRGRFGPGCEAIPVMPSALPYVYAKGEVDGIVVDILKGLSLQGELLPLSGNAEDVITYVLVVRKDFRHSPRFLHTLSTLREVAAELNDGEILAKVLGKYKGLTQMQARRVISLGVRFVPPQINQ
jgi:hypothetical protein